MEKPPGYAVHGGHDDRVGFEEGLKRGSQGTERRGFHRQDHQILGTQAETFATNIRQARQPAGDGPAAYRDPLEQLAELRALYAAGAVSEEEFAERKRRLIDEI